MGFAVYKPTQSGLWEISSGSVDSQSFLEHGSLCGGCEFCSLKVFFVVVHYLLSPDSHGILHPSEIKCPNWNKAVSWREKPNYVVLIWLMSMTLAEGSGATHPSHVKKRPKYARLCSYVLTTAFFTAETPFQITQPWVAHQKNNLLTDDPF